jgi:hypothetical protein
MVAGDEGCEISANQKGGIMPNQTGAENRMSAELKEIITNNISYFATSSPEGKPNVVQMGLVKAISDTELLLVDSFLNKTRKNLKANPQIALGVMDMQRLRSYQIKGRAEIVTKGDMFNKAFEIMQEKAKIRGNRLGEMKIESPEIKERLQRLMEIHQKIKPKAVILVRVEEIYSTWPGVKYRFQE